MQNSAKRTHFLVQGAIIAGIYIVLTYVQELILPSSATGAIQVRLSEALCVLVCFTPAAVSGITVGCLITNLLTVGVIPTDLVLGTLATFLAALTGYYLKKIRLFKIPFLSLFMPVLFNGVIIGLEVELFFIQGTFTFAGFLAQGLIIALGELIACVGLGIPLFLLLNKLNIFEKLS